MIIIDMLNCRTDGTQAVEQAEVDDSYFAEAENPAAPDPIIQIQLALAELAEAQAADQTATELALAELAELIAGGAN